METRPSKLTTSMYLVF